LGEFYHRNMILEDCILTKDSNKYWNQLIAERFPILLESDNIKYLSLKDYITEIPHKFYNHKLYEEYYFFGIFVSKYV